MWETTFCLEYTWNHLYCEEIIYVITGNYSLQFFCFSDLLFPIVLCVFLSGKNIFLFLYKKNGKKTEKYEMHISLVLQATPASLEYYESYFVQVLLLNTANKLYI